MRLSVQLAAATAVAALAVAALNSRSDNFISLWFTPDQQARMAYENLYFSQAADVFADPMWRGTAAYAAGRYVEAAETFGRIPSAVGFYNRGTAFIKGREYVRSIAALEQAVLEAPEWNEAADNLELVILILDYLEKSREQSDTGDETELGADEFKFDNTKKAGVEVTITRESTIALESAEKWMRSVDTETRDFLRIRFELENRQVDAP